MDFDELSMKDNQPVIFTAFHAYPWLIPPADVPA